MTTQRMVGPVVTRARRARRAIAVAALCAAPWLVGAQGVGSPDLILFGGKVFTADSTHAWVEAIAIRGDRITATGTNELMRALAGPATRMIDVGGRVVVPGFNDAHDHVGAARFAMMFTTVESLTPAPTLGQGHDALRTAAARAPVGTWLRTDIGMRFLDDPTAREIFGPADAIACGVFAPLGKATRSEDGYRVTGRWPFASGCEHSSHRMGGV